MSYMHECDQSGSLAMCGLIAKPTEKRLFDFGVAVTRHAWVRSRSVQVSGQVKEFDAEHLERAAFAEVRTSCKKGS